MLDILLGTGVPINSTSFMFAMVVGSAIAAVIIATNFLSFRQRSTNAASIISVVLLVTAAMVTNVTIGLRYTIRSPARMLRSPGRSSLSAWACSSFSPFFARR